MKHIHGTSARQMELLDDAPDVVIDRGRVTGPKPMLQVLRKDIYAELARRRRRAQIAARHELEKP